MYLGGVGGLIETSFGCGSYSPMYCQFKISVDFVEIGGGGGKLIGQAHKILAIITYSITLLGPMEFSVKLHTITSRWSIVYIEGSHVIISKSILYFFL